MRHTHVVIPLPAYNEDGSLIASTEYHTTLKGATALIHFDLTHWAFAAREGRPASDTFVANIRRMDVLRRPAPQTTGVTKHVLDMHDPLPSNVALGKRAKKD